MQSGSMRCAVAAVSMLAGCSTFVEHRAALVPHAAPVHTTGQVNTSRLGAALGATNIVDLASPTAGDPNAGVAIPQRQLRGSLSVALTRHATLGFAVEDGLRSSAQPVKDTLPPLDQKSVVGRGPFFTYTIETDSPWSVGVSLELLGWSIPYVEYSTCIDNCYGQPNTVVSHETIGIATAAFGIVPSYRTGNLSIFGGLTASNHPTIEEKVISNGFSEDVTGGPLNAILHAGVAYDASDRVRFVAEMHQTITTDPVQYGPGIGFAVELGFGPDVKPRAPTPLALPPGVAPAYPSSSPVYALPPGAPPPGAGPSTYTPAASPDNAAKAAELHKEAQAAAQAGECDRVRSLVAQIQSLDAATYAVAMQDKLIAYCVTP